MAEYLCPHCKMPIDDQDVLLCHFCGESLNRTSDGALGKIRGNQWIYLAITLVIIFGLIIIFS